MPLSSLSPLELLPAELLQPIFFLSDLNLSLVDASPYIAAKLADNYIYNAVCTTYLTTTDTLSSRSEQSRAQTRIFASQWMTWPYFQSWVLKAWENNGCLCGKTEDTGCFDKQWPPDFEDATRMLFTRSHLPVLAWVKGRLPVKLFRGLWTADKTQFLRFLLWITGMSVDWEDDECRRLVLEGRREAVLTGNLEVVELFNHNRRLGKAPNIEMVRFAVFEGGCDRSVVYDTMAAARIWNLRGDAWKDEELDNWCEERIKNSDPKGAWLKLKLEELRITQTAGDDTTFTVDGVEALLGRMHPKSGNYDDVAGDKLIVRPLNWNQALLKTASNTRACSATIHWTLLDPTTSGWTTSQLEKDNKACDYLEYIIDTWNSSNAGPYKGIASGFYPASYNMEPSYRVVRMKDHD